MRPLVAHVSRFDPWKDPLGVIAAWGLTREEVPGVQLALVGAMTDDDDHGFAVYEQAREAIAGEPDAHLLTNLTGIGALEVNAFQREADVVVQKSLREGFGLTVAEALWTQTPVVGGNAGGIPLQLGDGAGILVSSIQACVEGIVALLTDRAFAEQLGRAGHARVRRDFLTPEPSSGCSSRRRRRAANRARQAGSCLHTLDSAVIPHGAAWRAMTLE